MEKNKIGRPAKMLVIGGSAGSIEVILQVLPNIKTDINFPIVIVLHRKSSADSSLAELFAGRTLIPVKEIEDKETIFPGTIYVAPADYHLLFEKNNCFSLDFSEKVNYSRPSIDVTLESASDVFSENLACILLSGANADGAAGTRLVKQNGGQVVIQNPDSAESSFMPLQAIQATKTDFILDPGEMSSFINSF